MNLRPATRQEAQRLGLPRYFTGKSCRGGHRAERYANSGHCVECDRLKCQAYDRAHRSERSAAKRAARAANPDKFRARCAAWVKANPDGVRNYTRARRARVAGAPGAHGLADVQRLLTRQAWKCAYCRASLRRGYEVDHVVPLVLGGSNGPENLALACAPCNRRKGRSHAVEFAQREGRLL